jgi:hypothetical protein
MNRGIAFASLLSFVAVVSSSLAADAPKTACKADGRASYICGVRNVEDLIHIQNTSWVLAGQVGPPPTDGGAYFISTKDGAVRKAQLDFSKPGAAPYAACPGAPAPEVFASHGLGIRYGTAQVHEVFAVNHNGRESIEVFDLDVSKAVPSLTWKGCVIVPPSVSPNSVAPLPSGGFVVTSFGIRTDPKTFEKVLAGGISGFVAEWSPSAGWSEVPGSLLVADNGVDVSKDGKQLYVTTWGDSKLHILSRGELPHTHQTIDLSGFRPDNVRVLADGKLLIAGQAGEPSAIFTCTRQPVCTVGFKVVRFDPATSKLETLLDEPGSSVFGGASVAIVVGEELWVGTFRGDRVARYKLRQ